jgi:glycosyltransferase involved in cell wall biosynthesis
MHVVTRLNVGGIATQVFGFCDALQREGVEVMIVTGRVGANEADALQVVGRPACPVHVLPDVGRRIGLADARALVAMRAEMRAFAPDVVHTHAAKAGTLGRAAAWTTGVPARVHSFHGHVFHGYFSPAVSGAVVRFERLMGAITTAVAVPGASQRAEIGDRYRIVPSRKLRVVPYGVTMPPPPSAETRAAARARFGLTAPLVIGALGRMAPVKNQALLIDAFARLATDGRVGDAQLLFVGDGECRVDLETRARAAGLGDRVRFYSWIPDLAEAYAALDVLALSSRNEGMPVTALEAMAMGVPVVSTAVGGVVDLIRDGETGWLAPSGDVRGYADVLARVVGADRASVAARARAHVAEHHSFERAGTVLAATYRELLGARRA